MLFVGPLSLVMLVMVCMEESDACILMVGTSMPLMGMGACVI